LGIVEIAGPHIPEKYWQHQSHQAFATELEAQSITSAFMVPTQKSKIGAAMEFAMSQKRV
jgi:hypothetical protein